MEPKYDPETKTWIGACVPYPFGNSSVSELAFKNMKENLDHICMVGRIFFYGKNLNSNEFR